MQIKKIIIKNLKNLAYLEIDNLPNLVVIAGPNGTGKSTMLEAINIWKQAIAGYQLQQWMSQPQFAKLIRKGCAYAEITIEIIYSQLDIEYLSSIGRSGQVVPNGHEEVTIRIISNGQISFQGSQGPNFNCLQHLLLYPDRKLYPTAPIFDYYGPHRYLPSKEFNTFNTSALLPQYEQSRRIQPSFTIQQKADNLKDYLYMLNQQDLEWFADIRDRNPQGQFDLSQAPDSFKEIKSIIRQLLPHLEFAKVQNGTPIQFLFKVVGGAMVDLDELSSGEKEVLSLFLEIYRTDHINSLILIDEPELHLNQSVEARIVPYVNRNIVMNKGNQVFIVSHSPGILAGTPDDNLFRIDYYSNGSNQAKKITLSSERIEVLKNIVGDLGVFTTSDSFIFLEGTGSKKSFDKRILEIFLPHLKGKVSFIPGDNCKVVEIVSRKVQQILAEEVPFGKFYAIRDRDRLPDAEIAELKKEIPRLGVWPRCMIENFLLNVQAWEIVLRLIGIEKSQSEIEAVFNQAGNNIVHQEINLRINEYFISKIEIFNDFTDHPQYSTEDKLNKVKGTIEDEIVNLNNTKQVIIENIQRELQDQSFLNTFHGKNLLKEIKKILQISLPDENFIPLIANVMFENKLVPVDLVETVEGILQK